MLQAVINAFKIPDLRAKILFTLAMLVIFRMIASIPIPGVDREGLRAFIENNQLLNAAIALEIDTDLPQGRMCGNTVQAQALVAEDEPATDITSPC